MKMKKFAIGADIGGSHISCAAINLETKSIVAGSLAGLEVDNQASAEVIFDTWAAAIAKTISSIDRDELAGVGFAMPGPFNYEKGIALFTPQVVKFQSLHGLNVSEPIKKLLNLGVDCDMRYINDATAFALDESWMGKASAVKKIVAITLGTGFGSAFLDEGIPVVERNDVPEMGCFWHVPFNGAIADESFSTRWFITNYAKKSGHSVAGVKDIAKKVALDSLAQAVFDDFGTNLGVFLTPWLKKFGAEALVIGGNISGAYSLFGEALHESLDCSVAVHVSVLKENAALVGSARLFDEAVWPQIKPLLPRM